VHTDVPAGRAQSRRTAARLGRSVGPTTGHHPRRPHCRWAPPRRRALRETRLIKRQNFARGPAAAEAETDQSNDEASSPRAGAVVRER